MSNLSPSQFRGLPINWKNGLGFTCLETFFLLRWLALLFFWGLFPPTLFKSENERFID